MSCRECGVELPDALPLLGDQAEVHRPAAALEHGFEDAMFGARWLSGSIAIQHFARHVGLLGQPGDQWRRGLELLEPALAGVAQKGDVNCEPEPVVGAPPRRDQVQIFVWQNVVALQ